MDSENLKKKGSPWWYLLAIIPVIGTCFPAMYSSISPKLWGIPFFYWYQMLWVLISALITYIMYRKLRDN